MCTPIPVNDVPITVELTGETTVHLGDPNAPMCTLTGTTAELLTFLERVRQALTGEPGPLGRLEILTVRDPDSSNDLSVFIDGTPDSTALTYDVDPGGGCELLEWAAETLTIRQSTEFTPAFRDAIVDARDTYNEHTLIEDTCGHGADAVTLDTNGFAMCTTCG